MDITLTVPISAFVGAHVRSPWLHVFSFLFFSYLPLRGVMRFATYIQPVTLLIPSSLRKRTKLGANKLATLSCRGPEDFRLPVG